MVRRVIHIILILLLMLPEVAWAKKKVAVRKERPEAEVVQEQELRYYFYEAVRMFDASQYDDAMALLMHCQQIDPNDAATTHYLALLYSGLNNKEMARAHTKRAYELAPRDYWYPYAIMLFQSKQSKQAIQIVEKMLKSNPEDGEAAHTLQKMQMAVGDLKGAMKTQDAIDKIDGVDVYSVMQRYQLSRQMGKTKQAVATLENYLKKEPDEHYVQVFLGDVYLALGDSARAYQRYMEVEQNYPENPYLPLSLSSYWGERKDTVRAAQYIWKIIENDDMSADYKLDVLKDCQWLDEAGHVLAMESLVKQYPQEEQALLQLERYYKSQNRVEDTHELCKTIVALNPDNTEAWMDLMWTTLMDSTRGFMEKDSVILTVQSHLKDDDAVNRLATNMMRGDLWATECIHDSTKWTMLDTAFACYEQVLLVDPENTMVLNNYAYFLAVTGGDLRRAEKMSQQTIRKEPHNATFLDTYAWIMHLQNQFVLARVYMQQAMDNATEKSDPDLLEHYEIIMGKPYKE